MEKLLIYKDEKSMNIQPTTDYMKYPKMKFELISQDNRFITYGKGDRFSKICVEFDLELKHIYITESMFIRNDTPMLEPQSDWIAHSSKYGYTLQMCPTLGIDDLEFINQKANELFDKEITCKHTK